MLSPVPPATPFAVPNGGTGLATIPADRLMLGDGTNPVQSMTNGTSTQTIGFTGAGNTPQAIDFPAATSGDVYLDTNWSSWAANGTYANVTQGNGANLSMTLPSPGTYRLDVEVRTLLSVNAATGQIRARLYDLTAGAAVPNSAAICAYSSTTGTAGISDRLAPWSVRYAVAASATIVLQAYRDNSTSYGTTLLNTVDHTKIGYTKLY